MVEYPDAIGFDRFQSGLDPLLQGMAAGNDALPAAGLISCPRPWGVAAITLSCGGHTSTSFSDRGAATVAAGKTAVGRFWFLPKENDDVRVAWKLKNPDNAEQVTLALFRSGSGLPIWQRTLNTTDTVKEQLDDEWDGSWPADEWIAVGDFPDQLLTTRHSPYMLKITAEGSPEAGYVERWTYFDVLVHSIVLRWGPATWLPARADLAPLYSADTLHCETDLLAAVTLQSPGGGVVDPNARHLLRLHCDQFTQATAEMRGNPLFNRHREQWGNGTRIPLDAEVLLRRADGSGCSNAAVGPVLHGQRFLWDWESEDEVALIARHPSAAVRAFLTASLDYHRNNGTGPPNSTNCHVDHGGKRGPGTTVFEPPAAVVGPYGLTRAATRVWATFTSARTVGADVCHTGVLFQPSRMAGDTYKVSVYLAAEPGLDCVVAAPTLRADHPGLPQANTGMFEVVRLIHCAYLRKAPAVTAAALGATTAEYRQAGVELDWLAGPALTNEEARLRNNYDATVRLALDPAGALIDPATGVASVAYKAQARDVARVVSRAFNGIHQLDGNDGTGPGVVQSFVMWDWAAFQGRMRAAATRDYMINKFRYFNRPRTAYNKWRALHPAPADDTAYLLAYYNGLSAKKKGKVDAQQAALMANPAMPRDATAYRTKLKAVVQQLMKIVVQQFLIGAAAHRMTCIHSEDQYAMKSAAGALVEQYTDAGGFAPSDANAAQGRRSMNLIWVPTVISPARLLAPTYHTPAPQVIKHEIGHNFYLVHASAASDADNGPGADDRMHDDADKLCLMNYDNASDHLCGYCNLRLRGWATANALGAAGVAGATVVLSNVAATNRVVP